MKDRHAEKVQSNVDLLVSLSAVFVLKIGFHVYFFSVTWGWTDVALSKAKVQVGKMTS